MSTTKYYDHRNARPFELASDGCELAKWEQLYGTARFAIHPKGFRVFVSPDRLAASDEYADSDPYRMERNIDSAFNRRRIELMIQLVREVVSSQHGTPQVLDLGCGPGHITERLRRTLARAEFTGLDYSLSAIEYAHEHLLQKHVGTNCLAQNGYVQLVRSHHQLEATVFYLASRN